VTDDLAVGLLGAGLIAGVHARAYRAAAGVRLVAVADPVAAKAERLAGEHGAAVVDGLAGLLAAGVDVVDVCTPPRAHAEPTIAALAAGRTSSARSR
jgi:predicted dehydrogenase